MDFLPDNLNEYIENHTSPESEHLKSLNRETYQKVLQPRMLSGHLQGRVLSMLAHMIRPKYILEIGTYTGYSAICMAEGLAEGGHIHTIDINEELEPMVSKYLSLTGNTDKVTMHIGNAPDIIPDIDLPFDLVFIDADKSNYLAYYKMVINSLAIGAYIIADNVLWSGKVLDKTENDIDTQELVAFNTFVQNDKRVENVLFPVRDGLMIIRKITD